MKKKMVSLLTVGALLVSSTGIEAAKSTKKARARAGERAQRARSAVGTQKEKAVNYVGRFLSDLGNALQESRLNALSGNINEIINEHLIESVGAGVTGAWLAYGVVASIAELVRLFVEAAIAARRAAGFLGPDIDDL